MLSSLNGCDNCLSAHTYMGLNLVKLDELEIARNRAGSSGDQQADAAVRFAVKVAKEHDQVGDADLAAVKLAGFNEAQVIEIVGVVALNMLTNFVNNVAQTDIDFPVVRAVDAA